MSSNPAGFGHAPLTKVVFFSTVCCSLVMQVSQVTRGRIPFFVSLIAKAFVFHSPSDLVFGSVLLYHSRLFERQMGSGKYGAFLLFTGAVSKLMEHVSMRVCGLAGRMGPFNAVFANMINYLIDIPAVQHFSLFGMPLNDKAFLYLAGLQLMLSSGKSSILSASCGLLAGVLYRLNPFSIQTYKLPPFLLQLLEPYGDNRPFSPQLQRGVEAAHQPHQGMQGAAPPHTPQRPQVQVSQDALEQLMAMGFDRTSASAALMQTGNNVQAALSMLL